MKKSLLFISIFLFLMQSVIFSQEVSEPSSSQDESREVKSTDAQKYKFGITIKRMDYTYIPAEYNLSKNPTFYDPFHTTGNLKKNRQVILPFTFTYFNQNWNLYMEASHYTITYNDMYARRSGFDRDWGNTQQVTYKFNAYDSEFYTKTRRETKFNFYKQIQFNESNALFYGIGIRNIYKESYNKNISRYIYNEYRNSINSFGLQLFLKYQLQLTSKLSLNITGEPFITYGRRNLQEGLDPYVYYISLYQSLNGNPFLNGSINSIYGIETDLQFSYSLNKNLNLLLGYNYIYTKIRAGDIGSFFSNYPVSEIKDYIFGYYIGLNAKF